ncbi:MAG: sulfotransferase family protein [Bacteroidetes bacterium]|nr:sulfotransferase family protein [Bacteroidota bacterium]
MSLRINLCSGPRNVSTALMYSFAQRTDTHVIDEPLYAYYLRTTGAEHPGRDEILAHMNDDSDQVINKIFLGAFLDPVVFIKNMGHHLIDLNLDFLKKMTTVFLIRDPRQMLPSLINQIPYPTLADTALAMQRKVFDSLSELGQSPCVIDARELLSNPEKVLQQLCLLIGLTFDSAMLHWQAGPIAEDGIWAPYWYHVIHKSTGFAPYKAKTAPFPEVLCPLLEECLPHYNYLYQFAIRA